MISKSVKRTAPILNTVVFVFLIGFFSFGSVVPSPAEIVSGIAVFESETRGDSRYGWIYAGGVGESWEFRVGDRGPAGGIVFFDKGSYSDGWRYLEAWVSDEGGYRWQTDIEGTRGTGTEIGTGFGNTYRILMGGGYPAAEAARNVVHGGYDDWFLPSKGELNLLYENRDIIGGFSEGGYWSSSEYYSGDAWEQYFGNGQQYFDGKYYGYRVRVVRAF